MNKPIFITLHGYKTGKTFIINANLIEQPNPVPNENFTELYMAGSFNRTSDGVRIPHYRVRESYEEIQTLISQAALTKL